MTNELDIDAIKVLLDKLGITVEFDDSGMLYVHVTRKDISDRKCVNVCAWNDVSFGYSTALEVLSAISGAIKDIEGKVK